MKQVIIFCISLAIGLVGQANGGVFYHAVPAAMGEIQGRVTNDTGKPLEQVSVMVTRNNNQLAETSTDENGFYSIQIFFIQKVI